MTTELVRRSTDRDRRRRPSPAVTHPAPEVDLDAAARPPRALLAALGLPVDSPDMSETPRRMVAPTPRCSPCPTST